jgi:predicted TPR repeat methyltransferase
MTADELTSIALDHHDNSDLPRAESFYRQALSQNPAHAQATHFLGVLYRQLGKNAEGLALIQRSITLDPSNPRYHFHLGNALDEDCRFADAEAAYRRALELEPRYDTARMNLGIVLQSQGRFEPAIETLEKLVELAPKSLQARFNLARVLESVGRQVDSIEQLRQAVTIDRSATTLTWLGSKLRRYGNLDESVGIMQQAVAADPANLEAWLELGHSLAAKSATPPISPAAAQAFARALQLDPSNEDPAFFLAVAQGQTPKTSPTNFIREMYDGYADHFDQHLVGILKYSAPERLHQLVSSFLESPAARIKSPLDILDAGCGTGLAAPLFKPLAKTLTGIDLSPNMIRQATARNLYTELHVDDLIAALAKRPASFDLILALEVFIHLGDLAPAFAAAHRALRPNGILAYSVEAHSGGGNGTGGGVNPNYALSRGRRFAHSQTYLQNLADTHHFKQHTLETATLRQEKGIDVPGLLVLLEKA